MNTDDSTPSRLLVVESEDHFEGEADHTFYIDEELRKITDDEYDNMYSFLRSADVNAETTFPLYWLINWQFLYPPRNEMALSYLLPLSARLEDRIANLNVDEVVCIDLPNQYRVVVRDVAESNRVTVSHRTRGDGNSGPSFSRVAFSLVVTLGLFVDQLVSVLLGIVLDVPDQAETIFVPSAGRVESTMPVFQAVSQPAVSVVSILTTTWYFAVFRGRYDDISDYDFVPVNLYATPRTIWRGMKMYAELVLEVLVYRSLDKNLEEAIESEVDVASHHTVRYALNEIYQPYLFINVLMTHVFFTAIQRTGCDNIVSSIGSGAAAQSIWYAGERANIDNYYLPHSISLAWRKRAPKMVKKFVPGSVAIEDVTARKQIKHTENLIPTGRPYLSDLYDARSKYVSDSRNESEEIDILIATEPLDDKIRGSFVRGVVTVVEAMSSPVTVCVKTHPDEDISFYESLRNSLEVDFTITEDALHDRIAESDLVVTMASNVGLEAIILGTPNVCVTEWRPFVRPLPYAQLGPVPILTSQYELQKFFSQLDIKTLQTLGEEQWAYVSESYELKSDVTRGIAEYIEADTEGKQDGFDAIQSNDSRA